MSRSEWEPLGGFFAAVRAGEPVATYLSQSYPLPVLIPLALWFANENGKLLPAVLCWALGFIVFHIIWLPSLRNHTHPPRGLSQNNAAITSIAAVYWAPQLWLLFAGFMLMGAALALASNSRFTAAFHLLGAVLSVIIGLRTGFTNTATVVAFMLLIVPMGFASVAFKAAELGWQQRRLSSTLAASGATAWDIEPDGTVGGVLGVPLDGVETGTRLARVLHPDDERPAQPQPGATLEYRIRDSKHRWRWIRENVEAASSASLTRRSGVVDITEERRLAEETERHATTDHLTQLANRTSHVTMADRSAKHGTGALILVDLDGFKNVNDSLGHSVGDRVLSLIGERFAGVEGPKHLARIGGDEFAILVEGEASTALEVAEKLIGVASEPLTIATMVVSMGASAGVANFEPDLGADEVRRRAGVSLREAKKTGESLVVYSESLENQSTRRVELAARLPTALANGEIVLFHQPKLDLQAGSIVGTEALVRWRHPDFGIVAPPDFLDLVTVGGHHRTLLDVVLQNALIDLTAIIEQTADSNQTVAVNLHTHNLRERDLCDRVLLAVEAAGLAPHHLVLELTEDALIIEEDIVSETLHQLHDAGIKLSVDDFGTGYSALAYLARLPVSEVKIDRSLASQVTCAPRERAVVESVLDLASRLGLNVVAEGIEDQETLDCLATMGCAVGQGYHIGRPNPVERTNTPTPGSGIEATQSRSGGWQSAPSHESPF